MALSKALGYTKTEVPYSGLEELVKCPHLGGLNARKRLSL
jgi:hypothetical protein